MNDATTLGRIDEETRSLVQIAAAIAGADEITTRDVMERASPSVDNSKVEEVILQSYLFAGFPRTLNAARIWRSISSTPAPGDDSEAKHTNSAQWEERGQETCRTVYGESYEMLRQNIRALHPALDTWMITDGYGKVLSRPGLDLKTRELCIVAACAATAQQRQLHSHLHGALNAGASVGEVESALAALSGLVPDGDLEKYFSLLAHVTSRRHPPRGKADVR
ncbi:MAG TPA: carboxymuconolactone decarboxylase family protein [Gemmatimonadaceae bacterium]|jgi:4-carboxymuconolactone decarboxylase|nr:carboxymuconolactone decarboxylase family protein [Gemmatimonadaceae bacterium]